jgi:hypothetical protein
MEFEIHFFSIILVICAAVVPSYLCYKLKRDLRVLTGFLAIFLFVHAGYHIAGIFGLVNLEDNIEIFSVVLLIIFGLIFLKIRDRRKSVKV